MPRHFKQEHRNCNSIRALDGGYRHNRAFFSLNLIKNYLNNGKVTDFFFFFVWQIPKIKVLFFFFFNVMLVQHENSKLNQWRKRKVVQKEEVVGCSGSSVQIRQRFWNISVADLFSNTHKQFNINNHPIPA